MMMTQTASTKVMFVTGSASGIGRRLTERLIGLGHRVAATDIRLAPLLEFAREKKFPEDRFLCLEQDVRDPEAWTRCIDAAVQKFDRLDVLFNIAGYLQGECLFNADPATTHLHIDVNVKGLIFGTQAAAKVMVAQKSGHIVNMASVAGIGPVPGMAVYAASKYAVRGFSLSAAAELMEHGVMVTAVCPDSVNTPMLARQRTVDESALMFSGRRPLEIDELIDAILLKALPRRPFEVRIPWSRCRLARFADSFPGLVKWIAPFLWKKGRTEQRRVLAALGPASPEDAPPR